MVVFAPGLVRRWLVVGALGATFVAVAAPISCSGDADPNGTSNNAATTAAGPEPDAGGGGGGAQPDAGPPDAPPPPLSVVVTSGTQITLTFPQAMHAPWNNPNDFRLSHPMNLAAGADYYVPCACLAGEDPECNKPTCQEDEVYLTRDACVFAQTNCFATCNHRVLDAPATLWVDVRGGIAYGEYPDATFTSLHATSPTTWVATLHHGLDEGICDPATERAVMKLHYRRGVAAVLTTDLVEMPDASPRWVDSKDSLIVRASDPPFLPWDVDASLVDGVCSGDSCHDGLLDGTEADVDCGPDCDLCDLGRTCMADDACASGFCALALPFLADTHPGQCAIRCATNEDCGSNACIPFTLPAVASDGFAACGVATCADRLQDGDELGVDCGGSCPACAGAPCVAPGDCASTICEAGACQPLRAADIAVGGFPTAEGFSATACAVTQGGAASCWGGFSGTSPRVVLSPAPVAGLGSAVTSIGLGARRGCAVAGDKALCWGDNHDGSLLVGSTDDLVTAPAAVIGLDDVAAVASAYDASCALTHAGDVRCWGRWGGSVSPSVAAVSGLPANVRAIAASSDAGRACAIDAGAGVWCWEDALVAKQIAGLSGALEVAVGATHACARTAADVRCWGTNSKGELGDGTTQMSPTPVVVQGLAAGVRSVVVAGQHSCAVSAAGAALCWGDGTQSSVADGASKHLAPTAIAALPSGVAKLSAAPSLTCARMEDGRVLCWGWAPTGDGWVGDNASPAPVQGF